MVNDGKQMPVNTPKVKYRVRPLFCGRAVFADESSFYRIPQEANPGDPVRVRIRTLADNVDEVWLRITGNGEKIKYIEMKVLFRRNGFDYYEAAFMAGHGPTDYDFELRRDGRIWRYSRMGLTGGDEWYYPFHFSVGYHVPEWAQGAVMYQIFTDRFYNGDPSNDVVNGEYTYIGREVRKVEDWNSLPKDFDVHRFYGGDLQGILDKLDYLQDLGVEVLYLNPIFVSPSNHKYDTQDYSHVDPHFGKIVNDTENREGIERYRVRTTDPENLAASDELLRKLISELHKRGMRILLDGVFNHCGSFSEWFDAEGVYQGVEGAKPGAYHNWDSPYRPYFRFSNPLGWPDNDSCDYWWGNKTLPKLAHEDCPELRETIMKIAEKWVSEPYCADGWRLDVAADLGYDSDFNHRFWQVFRSRVRKVNPEALILAEHYGDASSYLNGGEWDTVMNYDAFMDPVSYFLTGMEKHSDASSPERIGDGYTFSETMRLRMCQFGTPSLMCAMNELSNHDHSRFLTRTNHKVGRAKDLGRNAAVEGVSFAVMRQAVLMQMTWIGAPTVYYGDEAGVAGFTDPDSRRTYPWGRENKELLEYYKKAIAVHRKYDALRKGSLKMITCGQDFICYARFTDSQWVLCTVYTGKEARPETIPVWEAGLLRNGNGRMKRVLRTAADGYDDFPVTVPVNGGMMQIVCAPQEAAVFVWEGDSPEFTK